jgi:hypothetical protein
MAKTTNKKKAVPQEETVEILKSEYQNLKQAYGENIVLRQRMSIMEQEIVSLDNDFGVLEDENERLKADLLRISTPWYKLLIQKIKDLCTTKQQ